MMACLPQAVYVPKSSQKLNAEMGIWIAGKKSCQSHEIQKWAFGHLFCVAESLRGQALEKETGNKLSESCKSEHEVPAEHQGWGYCWDIADHVFI